MVEPVRHRQTKGAATDMLEPKATASHLDSTIRDQVKPEPRIMRYELSDYEVHDNRLCSVLLGALPPKRCYSRIADTIQTGSGNLRASKEHGQTFRQTKSQRPDLLQPVSVSRAQLDRTVLQQDQAMSACRDPIRQTRGQLSGVHQARINPHLATR